MFTSSLIVFIPTNSVLFTQLSDKYSTEVIQCQIILDFTVHSSLTYDKLTCILKQDDESPIEFTHKHTW